MLQDIILMKIARNTKPKRIYTKTCDVKEQSLPFRLAGLQSCENKLHALNKRYTRLVRLPIDFLLPINFLLIIQNVYSFFIED